MKKKLPLIKTRHNSNLSLKLITCSKQALFILRNAVLTALLYSTVALNKSINYFNF